MAQERAKKSGINILDVLIFAAMIVVLVFAIIQFTGKNPLAKIEPVPIEYVCLVPKVEAKTLEGVDQYTPDQLVGSGDLIDAYLVSYEAVPALHWVELESGAVAEVEDPTRFDVYFTVQGQVEDAVSNALGIQEIRLGKPHMLRTVHMEFTQGTIVSVVWGDDVVYAPEVPLGK